MAGKYEKRKTGSRGKQKKQILLLVALIALVSIAGGATVAYLLTVSDPVENTFVPGSVTCVVNDDYTVSVTSDSNVSGYIRAAVLVNWMDDDGNVYAIAPQPGIYQVTCNGAKWSQSGNYYYYEDPVAPGTATSALITTVSAPTGDPPTGYTFTVEVLAEVIQAKPADTFQSAWELSSRNP